MASWNPEFTHEGLPMRVRMRPGALADLAGEAESLGLNRMLVLSTPGQEETARAVSNALGERTAGVHPHAAAHVPTTSADAANAAVRATGADGCVAIGGGSAIGLGKAVALRQRLPVIAVPTTYAGSEMTPVWGITDEDGKHTGRDQGVLPTSVLYDPELTTTLPPRTSTVSGINAIAHAAEALYAPNSSPLTALMAEEGVRALAEALPAVTADPSDTAARGRAQYGAWLCGSCLATATMGLHHKLCHVLGGMLDLPHAATHATVLPHVLAYNTPATPHAHTALRRALGSDNPASALRALASTASAPTTLAELGMTPADIEPVTERVLAAPYTNPRPVTAEGVRGILRSAMGES